VWCWSLPIVHSTAVCDLTEPCQVHSIPLFATWQSLAKFTQYRCLRPDRALPSSLNTAVCYLTEPCQVHSVPLFATWQNLVKFTQYRCLLPDRTLPSSLSTAVCYLTEPCQVHSVPLFVTLQSRSMVFNFKLCIGFLLPFLEYGGLTCLATFCVLLQFLYFIAWCSVVINCGHRRRNFWLHKSLEVSLLHPAKLLHVFSTGHRC
jgi:hypothetical protein